MSWWQYLILANIYLALFYAFYIVLLRKETFFQLNRIYLISSAVLSFIIPVIQADWVKNLFITQQVQYTIYSNPVIIRSFGPAVTATGISTGKLLVIIYLTGIALLTVKLIWQTTLLKRMLRQPKPTDAYSFFRKIQIGAAYANNKAIARHESTHANQLHSADIMLAELMMIINWFNPVVYYYRRSISNIHEYIADQCALDAASGTREYAVMLLNQALNVPVNKLVNPFFNDSSLKQRIIMLYKNKSNRIALAKYGFSAPLFVLMLILSSATVNNSKAVKLINLNIEDVALLPASQVKNVLGNAQSLSIGVPDKQTNGDTTKKGTKIFTSAERMPDFPGGSPAFYKFLGSNIHYPADVKKDAVQGKVVLTFVVEKDGSLTGVKVIRSLYPSADRESVRVIKLSPKWNPGYQKGKPVRAQYTVPISYSLEDVTPTNKTGVVNLPLNKDITRNQIDKTDTTITNSNHQAESPLYILNGKEASDISGVNPADIESMSVLKGEHVPLKYREKGRSGVVTVTMRIGKFKGNSKQTKPQT